VSARWPRPLVAAVDLVNRRGKAWGVRLVKYTGTSHHLVHHFVHPEHPVDAPGRDGYVEYLDPDAPAQARTREPRNGRAQAR
jgi:hypothetical protein